MAVPKRVDATRNYTVLDYVSSQRLKIWLIRRAWLDLGNPSVFLVDIVTSGREGEGLTQQTSHAFGSEPTRIAQWSWKNVTKRSHYPDTEC